MSQPCRDHLRTTFETAMQERYQAEVWLQPLFPFRGPGNQEDGIQ